MASFFRSLLVASLLWCPCGGAHSSSSSPELCADGRHAPAARSIGQELLRRKVDGALKEFWNYTRNGFSISSDEKTLILDVQEKSRQGARRPDGSESTPALRPHSDTYGEVTRIGVRQIAQMLGLDSLGNEGAVFMDLGAGVGRFVVQVYLEFPGVRRSLGIELSPSRSEMARGAIADMSSSGVLQALRAESLASAALDSLDPAAPVGRPRPKVALSQEVSVAEADMYESDVSDVTHIYSASLSFCEGMLRRLAAKLSKEAPFLQAVASLRAFPDGLEGFNQTSIFAQMSWSQLDAKGTHVHLYTRERS